MGREWEIVRDLSSSAIFNDLSDHYPRFQGHTIIWH